MSAMTNTTDGARDEFVLTELAADHLEAVFGGVAVSRWADAYPLPFPVPVCL